MESEIVTLNKEFFNTLDNISKETERLLSDNESKDLKSRIAILAAEISEKTK
jgi:cell division septum initiation protein DivIVA